MPNRFELEESEVNITESNSNDNESNEGSRNHESKVIDDPKQGGKTSNTVRRELDIEPENEINIGNTWNGHVSPSKADIINDDENHEKEHNHQITNKFKESNSDIEQVKIVMAEIITEEKDIDDDRSQIQWNEVEVWESDANANNASPISLVEQGIDALTLIRVDTDEESDIETLWDAGSCKLVMHMDCRLESEEEIFWDSLSQLDEEIETVKGVNRDISAYFL